MDKKFKANPTTGIVKFEVDDKTYKLQYGMNGLCELQAAFDGRNVLDVFGSMENGDIDFNDIRAFFWAGLQEYHEKLTPKEAGKLAAKFGTFGEVLEMAQVAMALSFPENDGDDGDAGKTKAAA